MRIKKNYKTMGSSTNINFLLDSRYGIYVEEYFRDTLCMERKRAERSSNPFILMLLDIGILAKHKDRDKFLSKISDTVHISTREIDIKGWHIDGKVIGIIFTETDKKELGALKKKFSASLSDPEVLGPVLFSHIKISFHVFPHEQNGKEFETPIDSSLYPELTEKSSGRKSAMLAKRIFDVVGSLLGILIFLPFFIIIPVLIKLTSKGPILFRQARIGARGECFSFFKFRTMYVNNDETIHKEYVKKLIIEQAAHDSDGKEEVFKIKNDPRVTRIGRFLRKTSLDELPQFFNVLQGSMSMVGPRPPIPYEIENYDMWHLNRVIAFKPGITGLWQVKGRSRTTFNEMVRMDIRYMRGWSFWLDLKLVLQTPLSMIFSKGAF